MKVLLDTNIWSCVARAEAGLELRVKARAAGVQVTAAPSVLYELARMPDADSRRRALRLITEPHWERSMPEAYLEAMEVLSAMGRHRPEWLHQQFDITEFKRLEYDWRRRNAPAKRRLRSHNKAGTWERFRLGPDIAAAGLVRLEGGELALARAQSKSARQEIIAQQVHSAGPLSGVRARYQAPRSGWVDASIEFDAWRGDSLESFEYYLFRQAGGAYSDWLEPFVNVRSIAPTSWTSFWLQEVAASEVPRQWVRWAFSHLQRFRSTSAGTPCDAQLSAYLTDADVLVSADKQMVELTNECRNYAPVALARAERVPGGDAAVSAVFEVLAGCKDA